MQVPPPELRQLVLLGENQGWPHQGFLATIFRHPLHPTLWLGFPSHHLQTPPTPYPVAANQKPESPPEEL